MYKILRDNCHKLSLSRQNKIVPAFSFSLIIDQCPHHGVPASDEALIMESRHCQEKRTKQDVNNGHKRRVMMTKMISLMIIWIKGLSPHCYAENFCTACNDGNSEEQTREWHLNHPLSKERFLPQCQDSINLWFFTLALPGLPTKLPTSDRRHVSVQLRFSTWSPPDHSHHHRHFSSGSGFVVGPLLRVEGKVNLDSVFKRR